MLEFLKKVARPLARCRNRGCWERPYADGWCMLHYVQKILRDRRERDDPESR